MPVYALFRRGNYLLWLVAGLVPLCLAPKGGVIRRMVRWLQRDSWMESALYYTRRCGGSPCRLCNGRGGKLIHHVTVRAHATQGVMATVDEVFDNTEAYVFVALPDIGDDQTDRFYSQVAQCAYNGEGTTKNFLPWPATGCVGIGTGDNWRNATHLFCSEMIASFLQSSRGRYERMNLVPCQTTPQMLYNALITTADCNNQFVMRKAGLVRVNT